MRALRLGALVLVVAGLAVAVLTGVTPDVARLRDWAVAAGPAAPLAFALLCAVGSVALVPKPLLSVAGGVAFGPVLGAVVVVAGVTAGAVASFAVARGLGRDAVRDRLRHGRAAAVDALLARRGVWAVIGLRLLPVVPFGVVNYAAGLSGLRLGAFALGTAVGVVPATAVYTTTGASLTSMTAAQWALAAAAVALPAVVAFALTRRKHRESNVRDP